MATIKETGKILAKCEVKSGTSARGEWKRQDIVLEVRTGDTTHKDVVISLNSDQVEKIALAPVGSVIGVEYYVTAREYQGRWFNNVNAVNIVLPQSAAPVAAAPVESLEPQADDLPF